MSNDDVISRPMERSILRTVKKTLGLDEDYDAFDQDMYVWINSALSTLTDIGIGPMDGFTVDSDEETWEDFLEGDETLFQDAKAYVGLKVRLLFDPPLQSFRITAIEDQIKEFLWRMESRRDKIAHPHPLKEVPWLIVD